MVEWSRAKVLRVVLGIAWALAVGGCAVSGAVVQSRYIGTLSGCGAAVPATLTRTGDAVAFAPSDGVLILRGSVAADNSFNAVLNTQPVGKPEYVLQVHGTLAEHAAILSYVTPRCHTTATFSRM